MTAGAPGGSRGGRALAGLVATVALPGLWGCTERPLTEVDPESVPGPAVETREVLFPAEELPEWRDTSLAGFALPGDAGFFVLATETEFRSRIVGRFLNLPDSLIPPQDSVRVAVESFQDVSVRVRMDLESVFPPFPFRLRLFALARGFDGFGVSWAEAAPGEPWMAPGGDLGVELGSAVVEEATDTVAVEATGVNPDSLLKAWRSADGEPGFLLLVDEPGAGIRVTEILLRFRAELEDGRDSGPRNFIPQFTRFIFDPPQPEPGAGLRAGGLPAWRIYLVFTPPSTVGEIPLRGSTVNLAELVFHPLAPPPDVFVPDRPLAVRGVELLGDPFQQGAKTPVGSPVALFVPLDPDSLAAGRPLRVDVTRLLAEQAASGGPPARISFGVRADPDAQGFGFWEFGSVEHPDPGLRPELRIIVSPPPLFQVP